MEFTEIVGVTAGVFTAVSLLPQLIKLVKHKKAEDISLFYLIILLCGLSLWVYYGFLRDDLPIILTNSFSLLLNIITLILGAKYKKKNP
ncbi:MAG TPA: SemiSWEET transporter [Ohtaekwangia sp.]|nr:SemiSWEET transporter [Ohtaekwangia sp.]